MLAPALAQTLSPVGVAFRLTLHPVHEEQSRSAPAARRLQLAFDYSQLMLPEYGGGFADRLTFFLGTGCRAASTIADGQTTLACDTLTPLPTRNESVERRLVLELGNEDASAESASAERADTPQAALQPDQPVKSTPPGPGALALLSPSALLVVAAGATGSQGDFGATPMSNVTDYQVGLLTGAATANYGFSVPPAAAGAAPDLQLNYNSGSVDGMSSGKNPQPGWAGIGWDLEPGYIARDLKQCGVAPAINDMCLTGDYYSIVLNGVSSRLVKVSGNFYRLQDDPHWKAEKKTDGATGHPDTQREYWWVTTPDGTRYRFGGEFEPLTNADQNSVYYVPVYDTTVCAAVSRKTCNKAWRWNLDRVEDTNGNASSYFYDLETNYYKSTNTTYGNAIMPYVTPATSARSSTPSAPMLPCSPMRRCSSSPRTGVPIRPIRPQAAPGRPTTPTRRVTWSAAPAPAARPSRPSGANCG